MKAFISFRSSLKTGSSSTKSLINPIAHKGRLFFQKESERSTNRSKEYFNSIFNTRKQYKKKLKFLSKLLRRITLSDFVSSDLIQIYYLKIMSFERFKFWSSKTESTNAKGDDSFLGQASNMMNIYLKKTQPNIQQFEEYLASVPSSLKKGKSVAKTKSGNTTSLKPQLLKKCYESVQKKYFDQKFSITNDFFTRNKRVNRQRQARMHEDLDQVQVCLFNQISSRFDQILSVLRTIESLQCIVTDNQKKLRKIRQNNLKVSNQAAKKQCKVVRIVNKKKRLEQTLQYIKKIKAFREFEQNQKSEIEISDQGKYRNSIQELKKDIPFYKKFQCTQIIEDRIQQYEGALKKSFSDSVNDSIFKYITQILPYEKVFWGRMQYKMDIFEDDKKDIDGTVILDESVLVQQEHVVIIKLVSEKEQLIFQNFRRGWTEGEYTVGALKAKIDGFLKNFHNNFMQDFRNYCVEMCQRFNKSIDNPSLPNMLNIMTISICVKIFQYFNDAHKNLLQRLFSVINRCTTYIINETKDQNKTIQQKQKLSNMLDGLINTQSFIFKIISDKICDLIEMKKVWQTTDLVQFKNLIGLLDCEEDFIQKKLKPLSKLQSPQQSFLKQKIQDLTNKVSLNIISKHKNQKLKAYLSQMHKFVVQSELKDTLQQETWQPIDIPTYYYDSLHFLISGQSLNLRRNRYARTTHHQSFNGSMMFESSILMDTVPNESLFNRQTSKAVIGNFRIIRNQITIEGNVYKVTQTVLLIIEILEDYLNLVQSYPVLKEEVGNKIFQLLRTYNSSSAQLILHAGAVVLGKIKTKNITSKHLALSSLCLSFVLYIITCILKRADIYDHKKLIENIQEHRKKTVEKLNTILMTKVNQSIQNINLDKSPSEGTQAIVNSTKILHDILMDYFQKPTLKQVFTKHTIKPYVDKIRSLQISNRLGAQALKDDITFYFSQLKFLHDLIPEFEQMRVQAQDTVRRAFQSL